MPPVLAAKEWTTTSAQLKDLFVKEVDSPVTFVKWTKYACYMREFLKLRVKGDYSV